MEDPDGRRAAGGLRGVLRTETPALPQGRDTVLAQSAPIRITLSRDAVSGAYFEPGTGWITVPDSDSERLADAIAGAVLRGHAHAAAHPDAERVTVTLAESERDAVSAVRQLPSA